MTLLLISSSSAIRRNYGDEGHIALMGYFRNLEGSLADRYGDTAFVMPDDAESMDFHNLPTIEMASGSGVRLALDQLWRVLEPSAIIILGGDHIVPFVRMANPTRNVGGDEDQEVLTDNLYGIPPGDSSKQAHLNPRVPVGRVPDPNPVILDQWLKILDAAFKPSPSPRSGLLAVVNSAWAQETRTLLSDMKATLRLAPDWIGAEEPITNAAVLYFKLHGFRKDPRWLGESPSTGLWFTAINPGDISSRSVRGTAILAENCYGAHTAGKSVNRSVALSLLAAGARAFIGATGYAWGSVLNRPQLIMKNADALADACLPLLLAGEKFGPALKKARASFLDKNRDNRFAQKTALEFVLYGNPLASL